tara:strand:- start:49 stop:300 length:252 start_codon:yes stop_codon:yes gene_type:complete
MKNTESKIFYTISEVSAMFSEPQYVLRFWENNFNKLKPMQKGNRRYYRSRDLKVLKRIRKLLRTDLYTIEGAKRKMSGKIKKK